MKVEGSYRGLTETPETIFECLTSFDILSRCVPGCKEFREIEPDVYECSLSLGYTGVVHVERVAPPHRWNLKVEGKGPVGSVKAGAAIELEPWGEAGTVVKYKGEFRLGGAASFLEKGLPYNVMIRSFFDNFKGEMEARNTE
jgi:uncharacterized protein